MPALLDGVVGPKLRDPPLSAAKLFSRNIGMIVSNDSCPGYIIGVVSHENPSAADAAAANYNAREISQLLRRVFSLSTYSDSGLIHVPARQRHI